MNQAKAPVDSSVVAVYHDNAAAERAVQQLHEAGFPLGDLSIVGRDLRYIEKPSGFVSPGDYAKVGAEAGASVGGLLGLLAGAALLVVPGLGLVVIAGPISAAVLGGIEAGLAGAAVGSLAGALVGWGIPKERALEHETEVKAGKFLVVVRSNPEAVARARSLLEPQAPDRIDVYEPPAS